MMSDADARAGYHFALEAMDVAVCEALAVSQAQAGRQAPTHIGYATFVFNRLCSHGIAMMRAVPLSRWMACEHEAWDFNLIAGHARAILEGYLYFLYLTQPANEANGEGRARITLLQLNDCCSRLKMFAADSTQAAHFEHQANELRDRLRSIPFFQRLPGTVQTSCLAGKKARFLDSTQLVELGGMDKESYDVWWNLLSQHAHIHPISFYRMEPNGRGSGMENEIDRDYLAMGLKTSAGFLGSATDRVVELWPDIADVRRGTQSSFDLGPVSDRRSFDSGP